MNGPIRLERFRVSSFVASQTITRVEGFTVCMMIRCKNEENSSRVSLILRKKQFWTTPMNSPCKDTVLNNTFELTPPCYRLEQPFWTHPVKKQSWTTPLNSPRDPPVLMNVYETHICANSLDVQFRTVCRSVEFQNIIVNEYFSFFCCRWVDY